MSPGVVDERRWRRRVCRTVFVVVVALFALLNVYRSATLTQSPASSHEFSHRQRLRHSPTPAAGSEPILPAATPRPEVDRLPLVRSVREDDYPAYNITVDSEQVRVVPLWQRRLRQRLPNSSANAALEDDIIGPYYFLTELLQVSIYDIILSSMTTTAVTIISQSKRSHCACTVFEKESNTDTRQTWKEHEKLICFKQLTRQQQLETLSVTHSKIIDGVPELKKMSRAWFLPRQLWV